MSRRIPALLFLLALSCVLFIEDAHAQYPARGRISAAGASAAAIITATGWSSDGTTTTTTQAISAGGGAFTVAANGDVTTRKILTANGSNVGDIQCRGDFYSGNGARFSVGYATGDVATDGAIHTTSTKTVGTIVMSGGTGTATVAAGAICVCSVDTAFLACQPSVSGTTLTVTVTAGGSNTVSYICL